MSTVHIFITEHLDSGRMRDLRADLMAMRNVSDVELADGAPHDLLVEYEAHTVSPMAIVQRLARHGVHSDITAC
jgi:hypothetical protein